MAWAMPSPRRRLAALALAVAVSVVHFWGAGQLADMLSLGSGASREATIRRMEVAFVRELQQAAPPPVAPARPKRRARPAPRPPTPASAPEAEPAAPEPAAPKPVPPAPDPEIVAKAPEPEPASDVASAPTGPPFEWPASTRLSYVITGNYQGPVDGLARVDWLRSGDRYQVHLDVFIGPSFAPLVTRSLSSEGRLTDAGLYPLLYEEVTKVALREPRVVKINLAGERIALANGSDAVRLPDVQDTASQFVQMTWLFTTQPQRLHVGGSVEIPLALPRRVGRWTYDVMAEEVLETSAGRVLTYHLKPRPESRRAGELLVDTWIAPTLQYLPVRIRIEQDAQTWVDLLIDRLPQQAVEPVTPGPPARE